MNTNNSHSFLLGRTLLPVPERRCNPARSCWATFACVVMAPLFMNLSSLAQTGSYTLDWFAIGAVGESSGGNFTVIGEIIQIEENKLTGGNFTLSGGLVGVLPTEEGAPRIEITRHDSTIDLSWSDGNGFVLEVTDALTTPISWTAVSTAAIAQGGKNTVTLQAPSSTRFYRLKRE